MAAAHTKQRASLSRAKSLGIARPNPTRRLSDERLAARARSKARLAAAIAAARSTVSAVARALRISATAVDGWLELDTSASPALGDLDAMPLSVRRAYYALAAADCYAPAGLGPEHHAMRVGAESGDVQRVTLEAAPGGYSAAELDRLIQEHVEARDAHTQAICDLRAMQDHQRRGR